MPTDNKITNQALGIQQGVNDLVPQLSDQDRSSVDKALGNLNSGLEAQGISPIQIQAETLGRGTRPRVPTRARETDDSFAGLLQGLDFGPTESEGQLDAVEQRILELQGGISGAAGFQQSESERLGIEGLTNDRQDLLNQFNALKAQSQINPLQVDQESRGRGRNANARGGIAASRNRETAIQALTVGAQLQAANGNLNTAINLVNNAVQAKYAPIQAELELRKAQLDVVEARAGRENSRRAAEQKLKVDLQLKDLERQQDIETDVQKIAMEAISRGATNGDEILESKSVSEAVRKSGGFLEDQSIKLNEALLKERIQSEKTSRSINYQRFKDGQAQQKFNQLKERATLGDTAALQELGIQTRTEGFTPLKSSERQRLNKELATSDTFKAIDKAQTSWRALKAYEDKFNETGVASNIYAPFDASEINSVHKTALLNMKEYYNLGVLNGPDLDVMEEMIPSATVNGFFNSVNPLSAPVKSNAIKVAIENQKSQFEDKLDDDYLTLRNQYGQYGGDQVTNLNTVDQKYVEMKLEMRPELKQILIDNPDMTPSEFIQVINTNL